MGRCGVHVTSESIFVFTTHKDSNGLGITEEPFFKLPSNADAYDIGKTILKSLSESKVGVEWSKQLATKIIDFAGFKSMTAFDKASIFFSVGEKNNQIEFIPSVPASKTGGFLHKPDDRTYCAADAEEIGKTLLALLGKRKELEK